MRLGTRMAVHLQVSRTPDPPASVTQVLKLKSYATTILQFVFILTLNAKKNGIQYKKMR